MKTKKTAFMQVLLQTKFGNLWGYNYDAGKPDRYGNSNAPAITEGEDGPYCNVYFWLS